MWTDFPKFLVGFIVLAVAVNLGVIPPVAVDTIARSSDALFLLAFAGLGFEIRLDEMVDAGLGPIGVVGVYLVLISALTYVLLGAQSAL